MRRCVTGSAIREWLGCEGDDGLPVLQILMTRHACDRRMLPDERKRGLRMVECGRRCPSGARVARLACLLQGSVVFVGVAGIAGGEETKI